MPVGGHGVQVTPALVERHHSHLWPSKVHPNFFLFLHTISRPSFIWLACLVRHPSASCIVGAGWGSEVCHQIRVHAVIWLLVYLTPVLILQILWVPHTSPFGLLHTSPGIKEQCRIVQQSPKLLRQQLMWRARTTRAWKSLVWMVDCTSDKSHRVFLTDEKMISQDP